MWCLQRLLIPFPAERIIPPVLLASTPSRWWQARVDASPGWSSVCIYGGKGRCQDGRTKIPDSTGSSILRDEVQSTCNLSIDLPSLCANQTAVLFPEEKKAVVSMRRDQLSLKNLEPQICICTHRIPKIERP